MTKIICTKGVLGGKERISGTRISVDLVYNYIKDDNITQIYSDYPHLKKDQIKVAVDYLDDKVHLAKEKVGLAPA
jgi:uncharacterized protein (DUF433 family)